MGGEVGHVERRQHLRRALGVIVGGAADQREAGQREKRVDPGRAAPEEEALCGRARVEAAGEGRYDGQPARFQLGDHGVIMGRVAGQDIGAHQ